MVTIRRLFKYNPTFFDEYGYQLEEWIDVSDIGKSFDGVIFTREEYLKVEKAYLSCFEYIMDQCHIEKLQVLKGGFDIEEMPNYQDYTFGLTDDDMINYEDKTWLDRADIRKFLKLQLRSLTEYGLTNQRDFFILGSWDMYFHVGTPMNKVIDLKEIRQRGLYFEHFTNYDPDIPESEDYKIFLPQYSE